MIMYAGARISKTDLESGNEHYGTILPDINESASVNQNAPASALASEFEERRRFGMKMGFSILGGQAVHPNLSWLDEADPKDLPTAADTIILAHAARMAIRSIARCENAYAKNHMNGGVTLDSGIIHSSIDYDEMMQERDAAVAFYMDTRLRQAQIEHLEDINRRGKTVKAPKQRLPRARVKKNSTQ